jgi:hypothetical protein
MFNGDSGLGRFGPTSRATMPYNDGVVESSDSSLPSDIWPHFMLCHILLRPIKRVAVRSVLVKLSQL